MKQVIYTLTCADEPEAQKITNAVLAAKCAACVKRAPVQSSYWWEGKIEEAREV
ncbi:divalent cation tolerance protein CutA, partial [Candidatus Saccharibacteria bacterium]|nr:divalent cation tolerance protein CutA [Candidatus Saccharibacteria bacterium]